MHVFKLGGDTPLTNVSHPDLGEGVKPWPICGVMARFAHTGGDAFMARAFFAQRHPHAVLSVLDG